MDTLSKYLNPKPSSVLKKQIEDQNSKHGKQMGSHLDDMGDIYDHTKVAFKKEGIVDQVDTGVRRIKGNISDMEMDEKVYGAKKVSREQREKNAQL